jgi:hypothetical protein
MPVSTASSIAPGIDPKYSESQHLSHARVDKEAMIQPLDYLSAPCWKRVPRCRMICISDSSGFAWTEQWPDILVGLTSEERRAVINAVADNVLEGWRPHRVDIEALADVVRGRCTTEEYIERVRRDHTT